MRTHASPPFFSHLHPFCSGAFSCRRLRCLRLEESTHLCSFAPSQLGFKARLLAPPHTLDRRETSSLRAVELATYARNLGVKRGVSLSSESV
jgi:hypothetical protein